MKLYRESRDVEPTKCELCGVSFEGVGSVFQYEDGGALKRATCRTCDRDERKADFIKSGLLTTWLVDHCILERAISERPGAKVFSGVNLRVCQAHDRIFEEIKVFEKHVWFGGLQKLARSSKTKGMSAEILGLKIRSFTMCGRAMITIEMHDSSITLICDEMSEEATMGLRGICATETFAAGLLRKARWYWESGHRLVEDSEVSI